MDKEGSTAQVTLPSITQVCLENFDLYTHNPNTKVHIEKNVFCLMGANGLGKSTFLNAINFALTGSVPDPLRKFISAQDYFKEVSRPDRSREYFSGRISEPYRDVASVSVELRWPNAIINVKRMFFEGKSVSKLTITDPVTGQHQVRSIENDEDSSELNDFYEAQVLHNCGLDDFAQFVFIMHFISTFDEGRHLLMWDDQALTNALYLAFGTDPAEAKKADKLKHEMDRESSRGRNVRFSAKHVSDRIKQLTDALTANDGEDFVPVEEITARHEALLERHKYTEKLVALKNNELRDIDLNWADLSSALTELQVEYRAIFSARLQKSSTIDHHPIIRTSILENQCAICGASDISESLTTKIENHECPLCDSPIEISSTEDETIPKLRDIDNEIIRVREELGVTLRSRKRLTEELSQAVSYEIEAHEALQNFENQESGKLTAIQAANSLPLLKEKIEALERERAEFLAQSQEHYRKRDTFRNELRKYEKKLKSQYDAGSQKFIPRLRELAEEFIGLPVDVELQHRQGANDSGFGLRLKMDDKLRLTSDKLSESQRFFIDIALRMALTEFMSNTPATLLIDTPEGSLDIAYEARAGAMFSKFVKAGNSILMTANLRSSQLVIRLANLQHLAGMQVIRMTDWTELSEVQQSEEQLFLNAYRDIDAALM